MIVGGLPGLLAGLGAFSLGGFHLFGLPSHIFSVAFQTYGLFCTFVEATVVVGAHVLVSRGLLPAIPVGVSRARDGLNLAYVS